MNSKKLMSKLSYVLFAGVLLSLAPTTALAQQGCVNSPEEPTLALGLLGLTVSAVTYFRARFGRK